VDRDEKQRWGLQVAAGAGTAGAQPLTPSGNVSNDMDWDTALFSDANVQ